MLLSFEDFNKITFGANEIKEQEEYLIFRRMSMKEQNMYVENERLFRKTYATAGIRLDFETDADIISFSYKMISASSIKPLF